VVAPGPVFDPTMNVAANLLNSRSALVMRLPLTEDDTGGVNLATVAPNGTLLLKTWVPAKNGGVLEVGCDRPGTRVALFHPKPADRAVDPNGAPLAPARRLKHFVKRGEFGWFYIGASPVNGTTRFFATFTEIGLARESESDDSDPLIPWNFWYYPYAVSRQDVSAWGSATLTPCQKYEAAFSASGALATEKAKHNDPTAKQPAWVGHCHNAAPASIVFRPPPAAGATVNGVHFNCEEIKFFATEFIGLFGDLDFLWGLPGTGSQGRNGPFQERRPSDDPLLFGKEAGKLHNALADTVLVNRRAGLVDMRDASGAAHEEVWNQALFKYEARLFETPGTDDWKNVTVRTTLRANEDTLPADHTASSGSPATIVADGPKPDGTPKGTRPSSDARRDQLLQYKLMFKDDGTIDVANPENRWTSCAVLPSGTETFAPRFLFSPKKPLATAKTGSDVNENIQRADVLNLVTLRDRFK
jgi:hypothetical protein